MADIDIRVETWGQHFDFRIEEDGEPVDLSACTSKKLRFMRPSGKLEVIPIFSDGTGANGVLRWIIERGQIGQDDEGEWRVEAEVVGIDRFNGPTNPAAFYVQGRLK